MTVERWCSMKEVCEHLGACHDTVVFWINNRNLPAVKIAGSWRFKMSEVMEWTESDDAANTKARKRFSTQVGHDETADRKPAVSYKPLFKMLIDKGMKKKDLAEKAGISIATITKMGRVGSHVNTDVLERICFALDCKLGDVVEIVQVTDREIIADEMGSDETAVRLNSSACEEYGLSPTEQDIVHFIFEQLQYYRDNPPSFMMNQARTEGGASSFEEAKRSIPTDRFYSLVLNEVIERWGYDGCAFNQKHISFKQIESGYFEAEEETFGEMKME